jgi:hypothetical protein
MRVALVVGLLFLAGAVYNLFGPEPDTAEALAGLAIAGVPTCFGQHRSRQPRSSQPVPQRP